MKNRLVLATLLAVLPFSSSALAARPPSTCEKKKDKKAQPGVAKKKKGKTGAEATPTEKRPSPDAEAGPSPEAGDGDEIQRGERVEFDARLIQGQTAKAGAVYLFERASTNLRSMVHQRAAMRDKIVASVFRPGEGQFASEAVEPTKPKKKAPEALKLETSEAKP
ncbi:MAG: hypothetical protein HY791_02415 [Deltaproteobacteria bacterium]|nr:hypothetical protein [Deltaproteobacteria bacterium]